MPYLGNTPSTSFATVVKDSFSGDGSETAFTLSKVATTNSVSVFVENVRQEPTTAYAVSGTTLTFTAAPPNASNNIYVLHMNPTTTTTHPAAQNLTAVDGTFTGTVTAGSTLDMNGTELILDADADTSITADTDDRIDFKTGGTDRLQVQSTSGNNVVIADGLTLTDGNVAVANGHGISFALTNDGGTSTPAELLDDYEEGSWTPSLTASGSININNATYTKVGKMVYVGAYINQIGDSTAIPNNSSVFGIGGLPFTVISGNSYHGAGAVSYSHSFDWDALGVDGITTTNAGTSIYFNRVDGSNATVKNSNVQGLTQFIFGVVYLTSD